MKSIKMRVKGSSQAKAATKKSSSPRKRTTARQSSTRVGGTRQKERVNREAAKEKNARRKNLKRIRDGIVGTSTAAAEKCAREVAAPLIAKHMRLSSTALYDALVMAYALVLAAEKRPEGPEGVLRACGAKRGLKKPFLAILHALWPVNEVGSSKSKVVQNRYSLYGRALEAAQAQRIKPNQLFDVLLKGGGIEGLAAKGRKKTKSLPKNSMALEKSNAAAAQKPDVVVAKTPASRNTPAYPKMHFGYASKSLRKRFYVQNGIIVAIIEVDPTDRKAMITEVGYIPKCYSDKHSTYLDDLIRSLSPKS